MPSGVREDNSWEAEVPELTEKQKLIVVETLHSLGRQEENLRQMRQMIQEYPVLLFPSRRGMD